MYYVIAWKYINEVADILPGNCVIFMDTNIFKHRIMFTKEWERIVSLSLKNNRI